MIVFRSTILYCISDRAPKVLDVWYAAALQGSLLHQSWHILHQKPCLLDCMHDYYHLLIDNLTLGSLAHFDAGGRSMHIEGCTVAQPNHKTRKG